MEFTKKGNTNLKEFFNELKITDPRIKVSENTIKIIPNYFNYPLITNLPFPIIVVYILKNETDLNVILLGILAVGIFVYNILNNLVSLNLIIINYENKSVTVIPNCITQIWKKKKIIDFNEIKGIYSVPDTFSLLFRRFRIKITLKNSEKVNLISAAEQKDANQLIKILFSHF